MNSEATPPPPPKKEKPKPEFKPVTGDEIDEILSKILREMGCTVPVRRLGEGYYIFGTRKIYCKILNGQVMVRVGGGYMGIVEFVDTYGDVELNKLEKAYEKGIDPIEEAEKQYSPGPKRGSSGRASFGNGSPRPGSGKSN